MSSAKKVDSIVFHLLKVNQSSQKKNWIDLNFFFAGPIWREERNDADWPTARDTSFFFLSPCRSQSSVTDLLCIDWLTWKGAWPRGHAVGSIKPKIRFRLKLASTFDSKARGLPFCCQSTQTVVESHVTGSKPVRIENYAIDNSIPNNVESHWIKLEAKSKKWPQSTAASRNQRTESSTNKKKRKRKNQRKLQLMK